MNIVYIAISTIKRNFRDKRAMIRSIMMPLIMILVLGAALSNILKVPKLGKINICYLDYDRKAGAEEFRRFLETKQIQKLLKVKNVSSIKEGKKLINDKKAVSLIVIPKEYSQKLKTEEMAPIKIYNSVYGDYKNTIVENIVDAYNSAGNAVMAIAKFNSKNISYTQYSTVNENMISTKGKAPRMIDYYAIAMLIFSIMSCSTFASDMISEDYFEEVGIRIKSSPVKRYERLMGKIIGCVFDIFVKSIIIIVFSKFVYGVNWGNNLGMVALIILSAALFSTLFGMFVTMAVGSGNRASGMLTALNIMFTLLAGGFAMIITSDVHTSLIMHLSPSFYSQTALLNVIYSNNYRINIHFFSTFGYILMLWAASALLYVGFMALERRRVR